MTITAASSAATPQTASRDSQYNYGSGASGNGGPIKMKQMRKTILILIFAASAAFIAVSCSDKSEEILWNPEWNGGNGDDEPADPDP